MRVRGPPRKTTTMSALTAASPTPKDDTDRRIARADGALRGREDGEGRRRRFTGGVRERRRGPAAAHHAAVEDARWFYRMLGPRDARRRGARVPLQPGGGADADVAASMEMSLATFLRLAARRLKTSRAVLAGQCKASGHRRSLERWGPVLTDAKKRLADALDLKTPPPSVMEKKGWFRSRSRDWRCAVSALKSQTVGGRWRLRAEISAPATSRDVRVDCRATDVQCGEELRRELGALQRAAASALGVNEEIPDLPAAASFTGGRVCRIAITQKGSVVKLSILACAPGAVNAALTTTSLDLRETDDVHVAVADICSEIGAAWGRLTRKERSRSKSRCACAAAAGQRRDDRARSRRRSSTSSALETADLAKLHKGKRAAPGPPRAQGEPLIHPHPCSTKTRVLGPLGTRTIAGAGFRRGSAAATPPPRASPTRRAWTPRGHVAARQRFRGLAAGDGEAHCSTQFDDALRRSASSAARGAASTAARRPRRPRRRRSRRPAAAAH